MKKYDRVFKQWLDEEEHKGKLSKRELCKGGREHDWILCLPHGVKVKDGHSELGLDNVEEYYKIQDEREDADIAFDERLDKLGLKTYTFNFHTAFYRRRSYICSVCLKQK